MRWLIVGHGKITSNFIDAARGIGHQVVAVAGRNSERASNFAIKNEIEKSGEDLLLLSEGVDAAYIATPHSKHCNCLLYTSPSTRDQRGSRKAGSGC